MTNPGYGFRMEIRGESPRTLVLMRSRYTIGGHIDADIHVPGAPIQLAELRFQTGAWVLQRLNPQGEIFFQGIPFRIKKLNPGDWVETRLFRCALVSQDTDAPGLDHPWQLEVVRGPDRGARIPLAHGRWVVGRNGGELWGKIAFRDPFLSRKHFTLTVTDATIILNDLGSKNGVRCGMRRVRRMRLDHGARFRAGRSGFRIRRTPNGSPGTESLRGQGTLRRRLVLIAVCGAVLAALFAAVSLV